MTKTKNSLKPINNVPTISSLEVADMLGMKHRDIINKLCGTKDKNGKRKQVGIIPVLTEANFRLSDYFIEDEYKDTSGKINKCYQITKKGCEILANKMTGEKGVLFTAKYVDKFNDMETVIKSDMDKANLLLSIYNGGQNAVLASKQLTEIEVQQATAPLIEDNNKKQEKIKEMKPKADFADKVTVSENCLDMNTVAKLVGEQEGVKLGRNKLFEFLREAGILMDNNVPYQKYINQDLFVVKEKVVQSRYGNAITSHTTYVTGKGQLYIARKLKTAIKKKQQLERLGIA